ncbi:MAG: alpha/beta hydrolase-fold protein, partial [Planctomycetota bacterium]
MSTLHVAPTHIFKNTAPRALRSMAVALALLSVSFPVGAQSNVRAWSADGQVFVVWQNAATAPLTYDIYRSAAPITSTSQGTLAGRVFEPEWSGERLKLASPTARWRVPTSNGGTYQLAGGEGLFVYTPRAASTEYFAVVSNANAVVTAANLTTSAVQVSFDPLNDPIECHLQLSGQTSLGYPFKTFALWAYGNDDSAAARPDMPVLANAAKHGAPHVFTVFEPLSGLPVGPYPATVCLHGGGPSGSHWAWAPESIHYANDEATPVGGITVAMDDRVFVSTNGVVNSDRPSNWFGWWPGMSPTSNSVPPNGAVVVPYTLRRLVWTLDWLQTRSTYAIDARRTSVMGNSMGGAGTLLLSRYRPERFSAATSFVPQHYTPDTGQRLFGTPAQNLLTTELGPSGSALRVNDFFDAAVRLSPQQRDYCLTRIFRGRRDTAVDWDQQVLDLYNDMNAGRWGTHLYWDNRDHTASDWTTDDPQTPTVDIGEWVAPVRTQ